MKALLSIATLILWVVALMDVFKSSMEKNKKILWALVIIVIPIVGAIVYFVVAKK